MQVLLTKNISDDEKLRGITHASADSSPKLNGKNIFPPAGHSRGFSAGEILKDF
jgi:hypothetical protein